MTLKRKLAVAAIAALGAAAAQAATTELVLYKSDHFRGPAQSIKGEVNNLENGMGREASSMVVRGGAWQVCTGDHFSGRCKVVHEGEYPTLGWLNDRIVSVKFLGAETNLDRYDNWDAKREARNEREDRRNWQDTQRNDYRPRADANAYDEKEYRGSDRSSYERPNPYDNRNWQR